MKECRSVSKRFPLLIRAHPLISTASRSRALTALQASTAGSRCSRPIKKNNKKKVKKFRALLIQKWSRNA